MPKGKCKNERDDEHYEKIICNFDDEECLGYELCEYYKESEEE